MNTTTYVIPEGTAEGDIVWCLLCDQRVVHRETTTCSVTECAGHSKCDACGADFTFGGYRELPDDDEGE